MIKLLLVLLLASCTQCAFTQTCTCAHIVEESQCQLSPKCNWNNQICVIDENYTDSQFEAQCQNLPQEDCRLSKVCAFYLGKCIDFTACKDYVIESCNQSSVSCASDGQQCLTSKQCKEYQTSVECKNRDKDNNLCYWNRNSEIKCQQVAQCEELPISLKTHQECQKILIKCTLKIGGGCQTIPNDCSELKFKEQCYITLYQKKKCFWDSKRELCLHKICPNAPYKTEDECQAFNTECTTDGQTCIYIAQCSEYLTKKACKFNILGKQCLFLNGVCIDRECDKAPSNYISQWECSQFIKGKECVSRAQGGCQDKPPNCEGFQTADSCFQQDDGKPCIWKVDHCKVRECLDAPKGYSNNECKAWKNCIGSPNGGCVDKPLECESIELLQACDYDLAGIKCFVSEIDNKCKRIKCSQLTLPAYDSHLKCNSMLDLCTFNPNFGGCVEFICPNIYEINVCVTDANSLPCRVVQGCVNKTCKNAPYTLTTHQQCQDWMSSCTVQFHQQNTLVYFKGCEDVKYGCQGYHQEQCFIDSQGFKCKWENETCIQSTCQDAAVTITTMQGCLDWKAFDLCSLDDTGSGCKSWPLACSGFITQSGCEIGIIGSNCIWNSTQCEDKGCENAPTTYSTNQDCRSWLSECNLTDFGFGCQIAQIDQECELQQNYSSHSDCHSWNTQCTIAPRILSQGCVGLLECSEYLSENQCKLSVNRTNCHWNSSEMVCQEKLCSFFTDNIIITRQNCEAFQDNCTINDFNYICIDKKSNCSDYTNATECTSTNTQSNCIWTGSCIDMTCSMNTTATLESECMTYLQYNYCQLKVLDTGQFGVGCENRQTICDNILTQQKCNKTLLQDGGQCIYVNSNCQLFGNSISELRDINSQQLCSYYNKSYVININGVGCHQFNSCDDIPQSECNKTIVYLDKNCIWDTNMNQCVEEADYCFDYIDQITCESASTKLEGKCEWKSNDCDHIHCANSQYTGFNFQECISLSPICYFRFLLNHCYVGNHCQDFTEQGPQDPENCNSRRQRDSSQKCSWNGTNCQIRACADLITAIGQDQSLICYQWKYDCVSKVGVGCKNYQNCNEISVYAQCIELNCEWQYGQGCVQTVQCSLDTNSITQYECRLVHINCDLNINKSIGCTYKSCQLVPTVECNNIVLNNNLRCSWNGSTCRDFDCTDFSANCLQVSPNCYYNSTTSKCDKILNCNISTIQSDCNLSKVSGQFCEWDSINSLCKLITLCSEILQPTQYTDCSSKLASCTIQVQFVGSKCIPKTLCPQYSNQHSCQVDVNNQQCSWDGTQCNDVQSECINYADQPTCDISKNTEGMPCFWSVECSERDCSNFNGTPSGINCNNWIECGFDGTNCIERPEHCSFYTSNTICDSQLYSTFNQNGQRCFWNGSCQERTCSNYTDTTYSIQQCQAWVYGCTVKPTLDGCTEKTDCTSAPIEYNTHQLCNSYLPECTVSSTIPFCIPLVSNCNYATQIQCHNNSLQQSCYWSDIQKTCLLLDSCNIIDSTVSTHTDCQQILSICTVSDSLQGCQIKENCDLYTLEDQCHSTQEGDPCFWSNNQCIWQSCSTAPISSYTHQSCQSYFNSECQMNTDGTLCIKALSACSGYNQIQCETVGSVNLDPIPCIWQNGSCIEYICQNGPIAATTIEECTTYSNMCTLGKCVDKLCEDFPYASDILCQMVLPNFICTTNGSKCINRGECQEMLNIAGCTYSKQGVYCEWYMNKCVVKTCQTAPNTFISDLECQSYFQGCTSKLGGGCTEMSTCDVAIVKEACNADINQQPCLWDYSQEICVYAQCIPKCGDGILTAGYEDCEDGNFIPYDGCYNCQFSCQIGCEVCQFGKCMECTEGWRSVLNGCETICGDGLVVGTEQCDDMNQVDHDGCSNCTFQCHEQCLTCDKGKCYQCQYGWNVVDSQCATYCGDGIMSGNEKCDDGNISSGDGCSRDCQEVEVDWVCKQDQHLYSNCFYSIKSNLELKYLTTKRQLVQEVQINFTGKLKLKSTFKGVFEEFIQVTIEEVPVTDYLVVIQSIVQASTELANISYQIQITLLVQVKRPKLTIKIVDDILENQYGVGLDIDRQTIYLNSPIIIEASTLATVESTLSFNEIIVYCLLGLSGLSILTGDLLMLWNLLDLLQHLSYLMYIDIAFPQHLQMYLTVFKKVTLKPLIDQLQIEETVKKINNGKLPFIKSKTKGSNGEINAYFLLNAKSFFVVVFVAFLTQFIFKILSSKYIYNRQIDFIQQTTVFYDQRPKLQYYATKIRKQLIRNLRYFYYSGLLRVFITNQYHLNYSALLQFRNPDFTNWNLATNTILAYVTLISQFVLLLWIFSKLQTRYVTNRSSYKIIFEDVKYEQWAVYYKALLIIRKVLYMGIIVLCQEEPAIQVFLLSLNSGVFTGYLIFTKPLSSNPEFLKIMLSELLFSLNTLSFLIYFLNISDTFFQLMGWIHIGMFSMILGIQLVIDLYSQVSKIIETIRKYRESMIKLEEQKKKDENVQNLFV